MFVASCSDEPFSERVPIGSAVRRDLAPATCDAAAAHAFFHGQATLVDEEETSTGARCTLELNADASSLHDLGVTVTECEDTRAHVQVTVDVDRDSGAWVHNPLETATRRNRECTVA